MNSRFSLDKLPSALRREIRHANEPLGRFFLLTDKRTGYRYVCGFKADLVEHVRSRDERMTERMLDTADEISDDADAALKLLEDDRMRAFALLQEIAKHVSAGHYNDLIIERLRKICEIEKLHTAEAILASVPPRQSQGPVEEWCMHALQLYSEMRIATLNAKQQIQKRILSK